MTPVPHIIDGTTHLDISHTADKWTAAKQLIATQSITWVLCYLLFTQTLNYVVKIVQSGRQKAQKTYRNKKLNTWSSRCFRRSLLLPHPGSRVIDQSKDISSLANRRKESGLVGRAPVRAVSNRCRALKVRFKFSTIKKCFYWNSPPTFNLPSLPFPLTILLSTLSVSTDHLPARKIN